MKKFMKNQLKVFQQIEKRLVTVMDMRKVQKLVLIEATKDQLKNQHTQHIIMLKNNFHVPYLQFPDTVLLDDYKMQLGFPKETARSAFLEHVESPGQKLRRAW